MEGLFSPQECDELIARSERQGYEAALVNIGGGHQQRMDDIRNNDRCIMDDPEIAALIWQRVQEAAASNDNKKLGLERVFQCHKYAGESWYPVGLNERLRFLRYRPHAFFKPHYDGSYQRSAEAGEARRGETSFLTLQLYLNQEFQGGETNFLNDVEDWSTESVAVTPKTGSVLIFQHDLLHEGAPTTSGKKFVIRTDVMFTNKGSGHEYGTSLIPTNSASDSFDEDMLHE